MTKILNQFKSIYRPDEKTLLAFSGGADSTALFYLLLELKREWNGFNFEAFHLNHSIRVDTAERDADFVRRICEENSIFLHLCQKDIPAIAREKKQSLEEAGRLVRYELMESILKERKLDSISTGHHQDDQLELFLMRLFQGVGLKSLCGMREKGLIIKRPLLPFNKKQILFYLESGKREYQIDETNLENHVLRNQIRNCLIPVIESIFPQYSKKIIQFQGMLLDKSEFIESQLIPWTHISRQQFLSLKEFKAIAPALWKDELLLGLKSLCQEYYLSYENLGMIEREILKWSGQGHKIFIETKNFSLIGSQFFLFFVDHLFFEENLESFTLKAGESALFQNFVLKNHGIADYFFRKPVLGEKIFFRKSKKLSDFLIDQKIHYHWRKKILIVEREDKPGNFSFSGVFDLIGTRLYLIHGEENSLKIHSK